MSIVQSSAYCATCQRQTLHTKPRISHLLHLVLSLLTAGLWAIFVWLPLGVMNSGKRAMCTQCGSKPGLGTLKHDFQQALRD